jgi:hypothetical protein
MYSKYNNNIITIIKKESIEMEDKLAKYFSQRNGIVIMSYFMLSGFEQICKSILATGRQDFHKLENKVINWRKMGGQNGFHGVSLKSELSN